MVYRKISRTWSHNSANHIPNFNKVFPELKNIGLEEMADRFIELDIEFYKEKKEVASAWIRLTLPFGLIMFVLMIIGTPINFIITGEWGYSLGKKNIILNWFRALRIQ